MGVEPLSSKSKCLTTKLFSIDGNKREGWSVSGKCFPVSWNGDIVNVKTSAATQSFPPRHQKAFLSSAFLFIPGPCSPRSCLWLLMMGKDSPDLCTEPAPAETLHVGLSSLNPFRTGISTIRFPKSGNILRPSKSCISTNYCLLWEVHLRLEKAAI